MMQPCLFYLHGISLLLLPEVESPDDRREQHPHLHLREVHAEALPRGVGEGQEALGPAAATAR